MNTPRFQQQHGPGYGSIYNRNYRARRHSGGFPPSFTGLGSGEPLVAGTLAASGAMALGIAAWKGFMAYTILAPVTRGKMPPKWALYWVGAWYLVNTVAIGVTGLGMTAGGAAAATSR